MHNVILHIGTEKTGTTSLQRFLLANKNFLLRNRILFPGWEAGQHKIALRASEFYGTSAPLGNFDFQAYRDALDKELSDHPRTTVLLSSEFFHSRISTTERMSVLCDLLRELDLKVGKIFVYFRDQASLAQAAYSEMVKAGRKSIINVTEVCSNYYFDHQRIAELWARQFGKPALTIQSYNRHKNGLIRHFCNAIGVNVDKSGIIWPTDSNQTASPILVEFLRKSNCRSLGLSPLEIYSKILPADRFEQHSIFDATELDILSRWFGPRNESLCADFGLNIADFLPHYEAKPGRYPELDCETFNYLLGLLPPTDLRSSEANDQ
jgi:hypothetical protein